MKVIFLDFDGVIFTYGSYDFSPVACRNLQILLNKIPDLKIIISSSWRHLGIEQCKNTLQAHGIDSARVIGITGDEFGCRGNQIRAYLERNPEITNFVILDDEYVGAGLENNIVKTNAYKGFNNSDINKIIKVLENNT